KYTCSSEKLVKPLANSDPKALWIGFFDYIPRWKKNSVIKYATSSHGYPSLGYAAYAATQLRLAAEEWNDVTGVPVKFEWVGDLDEAAFVLQYGGDKGTVLAEAFFPDEKPLNILYVYKGSFQPTMLPMLRNIFLHELGHVLGLRHEFANQEGGAEGGAVKWGKSNPDSVMSYVFPPTIQDSDKTDLVAFYEFSGSKIG
ncbi:hypothetical protein BKA67DRAFT_488290, partial [Truncatella angustata]